MKRNGKPNYTEEQLGQFNQDFSDGAPMGYSGLVALVHLWREEHDKVLHAYQQRMGEIACLSVGSIHHPNSWPKPKPEEKW